MTGGRAGSSPSPLRLGLVGCGRIAEVAYAPAVADLDGVEIVALADPSAERRRVLARALANGPLGEHGSAAELVDRADVEALVIASPPARHVADAELASAAAVPCLVEKPPAPDLAGAMRIAALETAPWIGFNRRFLHGAALERAQRASRGGQVRLELELRYRRRSWRPHEVRDDALLDLAPHLVDLALLGLGAEARATSAAAGASRAQLRLEGKAGVARIRCASDRSYLERIVIRPGAGGSAIAASRTGGAARNVLGRLPGRRHPLLASIAAQLAAFCAAVRGEDPGPLATAADGVRVMRVIEEAREAAG